MSYYFGFKPSEKLSKMLDDVLELLDTESDQPYYILRNKTAKQIGRELIESLLVEIINIIPNEERKAAMKKVVNTIEGSTETMLNLLLGKDKNAEVLPNIYYLRDETVFIDNMGVRRVGCQLTPDVAHSITDAFAKASNDKVDRVQLSQALITLNNVVLEHFISRFSQTLPLGIIKRKSVPLAYAGISKGIEMAVNKLFPQLDDEALTRLIRFYRPFIIEKPE